MGLWGVCGGNVVPFSQSRRHSLKSLLGGNDNDKNNNNKTISTTETGEQNFAKSQREKITFTHTPHRRREQPTLPNLLHLVLYAKRPQNQNKYKKKSPKAKPSPKQNPKRTTPSLPKEKRAFPFFPPPTPQMVF